MCSPSSNDADIPLQIRDEGWGQITGWGGDPAGWASLPRMSSWDIGDQALPLVCTRLTAVWFLESNLMCLIVPGEIRTLFHLESQDTLLTALSYGVAHNSIVRGNVSEGTGGWRNKKSNFLHDNSLNLFWIFAPTKYGEHSFQADPISHQNMFVQPSSPVAMRSYRFLHPPPEKSGHCTPRPHYNTTPVSSQKKHFCGNPCA